MLAPDFDQFVQSPANTMVTGASGTLSLDDPFRAILVLIFIALLVERALSVLYATSVWTWIRKPFVAIGASDGLKLYIAIIVNVSLAFLIHLDAFSLLTGSPATMFGMLLTGLFNSGGAKAWADVYSQWHAIRDEKVSQARMTTSRLGGSNGN